MIAIDTNVLVRFLTRDDEGQFRKAQALVERNPVFIPETVFLESEWVLRHAYGFERAAICDAFGKLLGLPNVSVERPERLAEAIDLARSGLDFADAMHLCSSEHCDAFATFDTACIKRAKGLWKRRVKQP